MERFRGSFQSLAKFGVLAFLISKDSEDSRTLALISKVRIGFESQSHRRIKIGLRMVRIQIGKNQGICIGLAMAKDTVYVDILRSAFAMNTTEGPCAGIVMLFQTIRDEVLRLGKFRAKEITLVNTFGSENRGSVHVADP